jgi:hypothetical protein
MYENLDGSPALSVNNGTVGPNLIYQTIDANPTNLSILWTADVDLGVFADPGQARVQQNDLKNFRSSKVVTDSRQTYGQH